MNIKLVDAIKRIVDKSSIGRLPVNYSGEYTLKVILHEGGIRDKREHIENKIKD